VLEKKAPKGAEQEITFRLPQEVSGGSAHVVGDFNDWSPTSHPMEKGESGFELTIVLEVGKAYRFRYFVDGVRWENDWAADDYVANDFGGDDSVVDLTEPAASAPEPPKPAKRARPSTKKRATKSG
jgi:1,4-alpha-glucan branching enzyme